MQLLAGPSLPSLPLQRVPLVEVYFEGAGGVQADIESTVLLQVVEKAYRAHTLRRCMRYEQRKSRLDVPMNGRRLERTGHYITVWST